MPGVHAAFRNPSRYVTERTQAPVWRLMYLLHQKRETSGFAGVSTAKNRPIVTALTARWNNTLRIASEGNYFLALPDRLL